MSGEFFEVKRERFDLLKPDRYLLQGSWPKEHEPLALLDEEELEAKLEPWEHTSALERFKDLDLIKGENVTLKVTIPPDIKAHKKLQIYAVQGQKRIRWFTIRAAELAARYEELNREEDPGIFRQMLSALDGNMNNYSAILLLEYRGTRILLPGDANRLGYGEIAPADLCAHIFKVGHHGQRDGADAALIQAVRPRAAVCCASSDRRYQSAHPELLRFLLDNGIDLWFSDCPQLPGLDLPPHEALVFSIGEEGAFQAEYTRGGSPYETAI